MKTVKKSYDRNTFLKRMLSFFVAFSLVLQLSGCGGGSLVNESMPEPIKKDEISVNALNQEAPTKREKEEVDFSTDRFGVDGVNAFYILPGLENIPGAMACFEVLDYNSLGEFVYYYVTPCYADPEEIEEYNSGSRKSGKVEDRDTMPDPEGRREDYEYDAEVLMSYNPDSGKYRVMLAKTYEIDKVNEFDPEKEGRPYFYLIKQEDSTYDAFISERALACKVAGREEYLIVDQGSLSGMVYDAWGNKKFTMTYKNTLDNEAKNKQDSLYKLRIDRTRMSDTDRFEGDEKFDKWLDSSGKNDQDVKPGGAGDNPMNVLITGVSMTDSYESYLGATFFLGDNPMAASAEISTTYMIYRQSLDTGNGAMPYISVNYNADKQRETWLSLDNKFFKSYDEYRNTLGYSMDDLKSGKSGDEYKDDFSPFIAGDEKGDASVFIEIPDIADIPSSWFDHNFMTELFKDSGVRESEITFLIYLLENKNTINDYDRRVMLLTHLTSLDIPAKRALQTIVADALPRGMKEKNADKDSASTLAFFNDYGWILKPGEYQDGSDIGFYTLAPVNVYGVSKMSDHTLSMVSSNGIYKNYIAPVDYFPEDSDNLNFEESIKKNYQTKLEMEPYETEEKRKRTCYIYDLETADKQKEEVIKESGLSDDVKATIDEITDILRTDTETWQNMELAWLVKEATGDMEELLDEIADKAEEANDDGDLDDDKYEEIEDFVEEQEEDMEDKDPETLYEEMRDDAEEKHDKGELSDEEYEQILKTIDKAEEEGLDVDEEVLERLLKGSTLIAEGQRAIARGSDRLKKKMLERVEELAKEIPEDIREGMLYLCAGFSIDVQECKEYPISYTLIFPQGATVTVKESGQAETVGGKSESFYDGVLIAAENTSKAFKGNTYAVGYKSAGVVDFFNKYTYGKAMDITPLSYDDGQSVRNILALRTDKGVRFFEKGGKDGFEERLDNIKLARFIGQENADILANVIDEKGMTGLTADEMDRIDRGEVEGVNSVSIELPEEMMKERRERELKSGIHNMYSPLEFKARGDEAYREVLLKGGLVNGVEKEDFLGFMSLRMLLTSSGYTREAEGRYEDALKESRERIEQKAATLSGNTSESANAADAESIDKELALDTSTLNVDFNERYTGHLTSSKNISLISKDKALICSMEGGTKILDLTYGTVADDMEGSYYRAFQMERSREFKLVGFENTDFSYTDTDLPRAKVYSVEYGETELERSVIDSFKQMLEQYAKDYLHREFRTEFGENDEITTKENTEEEKQESREAGRIFNPANKSYSTALLELEKKYGIERTTGEINDYVKDLRERIAGVKPAITRIYELAGARSLAGNTAKRSEGYWKNLESRMTMANEAEGLYDILVEIRMHDDVLPELDKEQADKYRSYKEVLDLTKDNGRVSANEIFGSEDGTSQLDSLSENGTGTERDRLRENYKQDVIKDIAEEYYTKTREGKLSAEEKEPSLFEKRENLRSYTSSLLNQINPDNFIAHRDSVADEFTDLINHGKGKVSGSGLEDMRKRIKEGLPAMDAVWKLEELVISEKVGNGSGYSGYKQWLTDYNDKVSTGELTGKERISFLRTSAAYKAVIGELKNDSSVKSFLKGRKETWDDYLSYVIKRTGRGEARTDESFEESKE